MSLLNEKIKHKMHLNVNNALLNNVANIFFFGDVTNKVSLIAFRLGRRIFSSKDIVSRLRARAIFVMTKNRKDASKNGAKQQTHIGEQ